MHFYAQRAHSKPFAKSKQTSKSELSALLVDDRPCPTTFKNVNMSDSEEDYSSAGSDGSDFEMESKPAFKKVLLSFSSPLLSQTHTCVRRHLSKLKLPLLPR